ncbi:MAG: response regulator [Limisphaerales bacterium]
MGGMECGSNDAVASGAMAGGERDRPPEFCARRGCRACPPEPAAPKAPGQGGAGDGQRARPVGVAVVDDDRRVWKGFFQALCASDGFNFCGSFGTAAEALEAVPRLPVRIVVVAAELPDICGVQCIRELRTRRHGMRFILSTRTPLDPLALRRAVAAGADWFLVKPFTAAQCLLALRLMAIRLQPIRTDFGLNEREEQVLCRLAEGMTYKEIGDRLGMSIFLVKKFMQRIFYKLQAHSRVIAVNKWRQMQ